MNEILEMHTLPTGQRLELVHGDLTLEKVDAIVNAANAQLQHGGGVAGLISRRGGHVIQEESDAWVHEHGPVSHATPAYTTAGQLPCSYVIHAVGPVWGEGDEDGKLAAAIDASLRLAEQLGLTSIALPALSTGIFGFPKKRAAGVILEAIQSYFEIQGTSRLNQVRVTLYDEETLKAFLDVWQSRGYTTQPAP